jgi:hypothetical protein
VLPNFFVVGANKAGTTSLYTYLRAHPEIFMSAVKEPTFYALEEGVVPAAPGSGRHWRLISDRAEYMALFDDVRDEIAIGEASTAYLPVAESAERIQRDVPHARIIAVLRDPVERARSAHAMHVGRGWEPITDFETAVAKELAGEATSKYIRGGFYADGVARYLQRFGPDRVQIYLYEEFRDDPEAVLQDLFGFLCVDRNFRPDLTERRNVSTVPKSSSVFKLTAGDSRIKRTIKRVLPRSARSAMKHKVETWNRTSPPPLSPEVRARLVDVYSDDIDRTAELIDRDLSAWRKV